MLRYYTNINDKEWELWVTKTYYTPLCLQMNRTVLVSPNIVIKNTYTSEYTYKNFKIFADLKYERPNVYIDQNKYIHFETKNFHLWSKILFKPSVA